MYVHDYMTTLSKLSYIFGILVVGSYENLAKSLLKVIEFKASKTEYIGFAYLYKLHTIDYDYYMQLDNILTIRIAFICSRMCAVLHKNKTSKSRSDNALRRHHRGATSKASEGTL